MAIDFSGVRVIVNGEPLDASVLNRPLLDLISILETDLTDLTLDFYTKPEVDALIADESLVNAIIFGGA